MPENVRANSYPHGAWCPDQNPKCVELSAQLKLEREQGQCKEDDVGKRHLNSKTEVSKIKLKI